jgi:hypothetical protein
MLGAVPEWIAAVVRKLRVHLSIYNCDTLTAIPYFPRILELSIEFYSQTSKMAFVVYCATCTLGNRSWLDGHTLLCFVVHGYVYKH